MGKFKVLIVGANFNNKGAQSMLFITVDELKRRVPDSEIYYAGCDVFDDKTYSFYDTIQMRPGKLP